MTNESIKDKKKKRDEMKEYKIKIESDILKEQFILTQSYHTDQEEMEKFKIYSLKELNNDDFNGGLLDSYFGNREKKMKTNDQKLEFGKIEQIFHIKNY